MSIDERYAALKQIRQEVVDLSESPLYEYRVENNYFPVIGEGDPYARIMIIGEAPGKNEAETGRPFCGQSGQLLDELLRSINLRRDEVYITNVVKDRPPNNRDPKRDEIALYRPFLERQINLIQPTVFATLGRFSMEFVLGMFDSPDKKGKITKMSGKILPVATSYGEAVVVPQLHPAYGLRNRNAKPDMMKHFAVLEQFMRT